MENRIAELKHDLGAERFCMQQFQVIEAPSTACWVSSICSPGFSVQQLWEVIASPAQSARKCSSAVPSSVAPARRPVLFMGKSWDGLDTRIP